MTQLYSPRHRLRWCGFFVALFSLVHVTSAQELVYANANATPWSSYEQRDLRDVLKEIQEHFHISFVYESTLIDGKTINGDVQYTKKC